MPSKFRHLYSVVLFHQVFVNVCNIVNINIIIWNRKIVDLSKEPSIFHSIDCEILRNIT